MKEYDEIREECTTGDSAFLRLMSLGLKANFAAVEVSPQPDHLGNLQTQFKGITTEDYDRLDIQVNCAFVGKAPSTCVLEQTTIDDHKQELKSCITRLS